MKRLTKLLHAAALALTLSAPALAADAGRVPVPAVPEAVKGEQCVQPVEVMRRKHMDYLMAHRDATMHEGIRTPKYSLNQCLECHVPAKEEVAAGQEQGQHFCQSCHMYAGVSVDCFQCHATRPEKTAAFHPVVSPGMQKYREVHQTRAGDVLDRLARTSDKTGVSE